MRQLTFHAVPAAATPLYVGEPDDMVREVAHLLCDHVAGTVYFRPLDPYDNFSLPEHVAQRFSIWELAALMPRRQINDLYREAAPLIEQLHAGTTVSRTDLGWVRSSTSDADAAFGVVADIMAQAPVAPAAWVPSSLKMRTRLDPAQSYRQLLERAGVAKPRILHWAGHGVEVIDDRRRSKVSYAIVDSGLAPSASKLEHSSRVNSILFSDEPVSLLKSIETAARAAILSNKSDIVWTSSSSAQLGRAFDREPGSSLNIKNVFRG